jgi:hypothetical protein
MSLSRLAVSSSSHFKFVIVVLAFFRISSRRIASSHIASHLESNRISNRTSKYVAYYLMLLAASMEYSPTGFFV